MTLITIPVGIFVRAGYLNSPTNHSQPGANGDRATTPATIRSITLPQLPLRSYSHSSSKVPIVTTISEREFLGELVASQARLADETLFCVDLWATANQLQAK